MLGEVITECDVHNLCRLYEIYPQEISALKERKRCVYACLNEGIETYKPLQSVHGSALEEFSLQNKTVVFSFVYEKVEGYEVEEDADAYREFTPEMLKNWGNVLGKLHTVSNKFTMQQKAFNRPIWHEVNDSDYTKYIPKEDTAIAEIFDDTITAIKSISKSNANYGLVHGDLHYGNYLITHSGLAVLDFDSSSYYFYAADIAISLYSLLPYPRYRIQERREFSKIFFEHFVNGYLDAYSLPQKELENIPLFLKCEDMANYIALYRHWDMDNLAKNQKRILKRNRYHIVNNIPLY